MALSTDALLNKIFRWKKPIDIDGNTYYMRVVNDQVIDDARRTALLESRKLRKILRDTNSDEFLMHLDPLEDLDDAGLKDLITFTGMREVMRNYLATNPRPSLTPLPDNPTQEEQEEYEAAKEKRESVYIDNMQEYVDAWREEFVKGLEKLTHEQLLGLARKNRVDQVCEDKFNGVFEEIVVAASIYTDDKYKNRLFTVEQFRELPIAIRQDLRDTYNALTVSPDDIKN